MHHTYSSLWNTNFNYRQGIYFSHLKRIVLLVCSNDRVWSFGNVIRNQAISRVVNHQSLWSIILLWSNFECLVGLQNSLPVFTHTLDSPYWTMAVPILCIFAEKGPSRVSIHRVSCKQMLDFYLTPSVGLRVDYSYYLYFDIYPNLTEWVVLKYRLEEIQHLKFIDIRLLISH